MRPANRLLALALTVCAGAGTIAAFAVAPATASRTATTPTIKLISTSKGKLLGVQGWVVYRFSHDGTGSKNTCVKISGCPQTWPALTTVSASSARQAAGPGVKRALIGTTRLPSGKKQVTYAGHPIYKYSGDIYLKKGSTSYVHFFEYNGYWNGVNANGGAVK
jgi:predicted lipoprotein with Yx(FWY)xxD motif